jgi:hypothetical protein
MPSSQAPTSTKEAAGFTLHTERLGPLPLINHFIERIGLHDTLSRHIPSDARCSITHASALGVLLRSIIVEREPIYRQHETVHGFADGMFGISAQEMEHLSDDRLGRALDRLFDADRTALLTELVLAVGQRFGVRFEEFHNDSTSISFCGGYRRARGRQIRARTAPAITFGHSKAHRPDLKQLLFILTMSADGNVPVAFRCTDGNTSDSVTHVQTWETLRAVAGRSDFLYVADSKLCSRENMDHIDRAGGRFVTVMPRSRLEDAQFREWLQTHTPEWSLVWDRPNPRYSDGPRDCWYVHRAPLPSMEAWSIVWVWSTLLTLRQHARRLRNIAAAIEEFERLRQRLASAKTRLRGAPEIDLQIKLIVDRHHVGRYLKVRRVVREEHVFKQTRRGRPGPDTAYRKITKRRFDVQWSTDEQAIAYDRRSDGMYPLMTNDRKLSAAQVLQAHKGPAHDREALRADQDRTPDRPGVPQGRGSHRGTVHPVRDRTAGAGPHRARAAPGHGARSHRGTAHLPRAAPVRASHHRAGAAPVQPGRAPSTASTRPHRSGIQPHTHRPAAQSARAARRPRKHVLGTSKRSPEITRKCVC